MLCYMKKKKWEQRKLDAMLNKDALSNIFANDFLLINAHFCKPNIVQLNGLLSFSS